MRSLSECRNEILHPLSGHGDYGYCIVPKASDKKFRKYEVYNVFGVLIILVSGDDIVGERVYTIV